MKVWSTIALVLCCAAPVAAQTVPRTSSGAELGTSTTPVRVDPTGTTTQPVSIGTAVAVTGTFWQVTQPISAASLPLPSGASTAAKQPALGTAGSASADVLTVQGIASMTALKVDGSAVTQPVSAASLPLPSGAATAAKQPALGTAGTPSADVLTVQGVTSMTALKVDPSGVTSPISAASLPLPSGAATGANQTGGGQKTQIVDGSGNVIGSTSNALNVAITSGAGSGGTSAADNAAFTAGTTSFTPAGGFYHSTRDTLTDGHTGALALTSKRALFVSPEDVNGVAATDATAHAVKTLAVDSSGTAITPSTDATTNTASQTTGPQIFLNGSTAAPTAVGLDGRSIAAWADTIGRLHVTGDSSMTALKVDGSAVTQPVSISGNQAVNLAQVAGATTATGHGTASGAIRVELPTDGTGVVGLNAGSAIIGKVAIDQTTPGTTNAVRPDTSGATGAAPPARADFIGGIASGATGGFIAGIPVCDSSKSVSITSATTTLMITGVSGRQVRICAIHLVTAIANNVALVEGTGATCGTGTAGMAGGTTAANGWNFAANGGLALGSGIGTVISTATTGDSVCLITGAAGPLAGTISYTIY